MNENLHFKQSLLDYINCKKQKQKRTRKISNYYWGRCGCESQWWDLSEVLSSFIVFICFLYCAKEGRVVENIESDETTLKILTTM